MKLIIRYLAQLDSNIESFLERGPKKERLNWNIHGTSSRYYRPGFCLHPPGRQLLLIKQRSGQGYWVLPGGVVRSGESVETAATREVKADTGLDIRLKKLVGIYSKPYENTLAITFVAEVIGGDLYTEGESTYLQYFPLSELPDNVRGHFQQRLDDFLSDQQQAFQRTQ